MKKLLIMTSALALLPVASYAVPKSGFTVSAQAGFSSGKAGYKGLANWYQDVIGTPSVYTAYPSDEPLNVNPSSQGFNMGAVTVGYQYAITPMFVLNLSAGALYSASTPVGILNAYNADGASFERSIKAQLSQGLSGLISLTAGVVFNNFEVYGGVGAVVTPFRVNTWELPVEAQQPEATNNAFQFKKTLWGIRPVVGFAYHASENVAFFLEGAYALYQQKVPITSQGTGAAGAGGPSQDANHPNELVDIYKFNATSKPTALSFMAGVRVTI